jgi:hypothetical protein
LRFQPYALLVVAALGVGCASRPDPPPFVAAGPTTPPNNMSAEGGIAPGTSLVPEGLLFPDLYTQRPTDLFFDVAEFDGEWRQVLRFTNRILNGGLGTLEVRGTADGGQVDQRLLRDDGTYLERVAGNVIHHSSHNHWHFDSVMAFEVWERATYERWLASGRKLGEARWRHAKLSSCLLDSEFALELPLTPGAPVYEEQCLPQLQGVSSGWVDVYDWTLPDQWVVLDNALLPDGEYVLRSVADPDNRIWESPGGEDPSVEGPEANEAVAFFAVANGELVEPQ